jgi:hypothetical protein
MVHVVGANSGTDRVGNKKKTPKNRQKTHLKAGFFGVYYGFLTLHLFLVQVTILHVKWLWMSLN